MIVRALINNIRIPYETGCYIGVGEITIHAFTGENLKLRTETRSIMSYANSVGEKVLFSLLIQEEGQPDRQFDIGDFIIMDFYKNTAENPSATMKLSAWKVFNPPHGYL